MGKKIGFRIIALHCPWVQISGRLACGFIKVRGDTDLGKDFIPPLRQFYLYISVFSVLSVVKSSSPQDLELQHLCASGDKINHSIPRRLLCHL